MGRRALPSPRLSRGTRHSVSVTRHRKALSPEGDDLPGGGL